MIILWIVIAAFVGNLLYQLTVILGQSGAFNGKGFGITVIVALIAGVAYSLTYQFITPGILSVTDILVALSAGYVASLGTGKIIADRATAKLNG